MWNVVVLVKCRYSCDECGEGGDFMAGKGSFFFAVRQWELGEIRGKGGRGEELTRPQIGWEESNRRREVDFCRRGLHPLEHKDVLHHP